MLFLRLLPRLAHRSPVAGGGGVCLLAVLLLTSCSSASPVTFHATSTATTKSPTISQATPPVIPGLAPVMTKLSAPPQQCVLRPPPQVLRLDHLGSNSDVHLVGGGPFWITAG